MMTNATYRAWRDHPTTLDAIGAWSGERVAMPGYAGLPRLTIADVTPTLFPMLQAQPLLGRLFAAGDDEPGRPPIAILSYGLWQRALGGRSDVVGQTIRFDTTTYAIVGVMPASFAFPDADLDGWRVLPMRPPARRGPFYSWGIARLRPGATIEQGRANIAANMIPHTNPPMCAALLIPLFVSPNMTLMPTKMFISTSRASTSRKPVSAACDATRTNPTGERKRGWLGSVRNNQCAVRKSFQPNLAQATTRANEGCAVSS